MEKKAAAVNLPTNLLALGTQQAENLLKTLKGFYYTLIFIIIFLILLIILNWSLFKGLNWSIATKKKFNFDFFKKFSLLNLVLIPFWVLLLFFALTGVKANTAPFFVLTILAISIYLTNILYVLFTKENNFKTIKKTFKLGFTKIHYFIIPYAIMILILFIFVKLVPLITLPQRASLIISVLAFTIFIAWSRLYIVEVIDSISI